MERLVSTRFPRASKYHPEWLIAAASGGANSLCLTEWLAEALELEEDRGRYRGYVPVVAHRRPDVKLEEPVLSVPTTYTRKPLLR